MDNSQELLQRMDSANTITGNRLFDDDEATGDDAPGQLTENDVELLMDALSDDAENGDEEDLEQPSVGENNQELLVRSSSDGLQSRYSFSLPIDGFGTDDANDSDVEEPQDDENNDEDDDDDDDENDEEPSEDATEPASISDEPVSNTSSGPGQRARAKKRNVQENTSDSNPKTVKSDETKSKDTDWDEARAVSHLLSSPYDSSFGLLSRIDTR